ncbi:MAG: NAD(P)-dependent oxidoreductase, partial [Bacteroidales bacterium]|nr:NAD(P)-dependent oxidoreductase [Bacteroidales bacterium]
MDTNTVHFPEKIVHEEQLEELISRPSQEAVDLFSRIDGAVLFLGVGGKIGPSLARMAKRACDASGTAKKIFGVSLFDSAEQRESIEKYGIETIHGDLLDQAFIQTLPRVKNVFFLAGMKFGSEENLSLTWAVNSYLPALVVENFSESRIVAFSTGCVYPLVPVETGGSKESDKPGPVGEYAQSCLGRERMFEYGSKKNNTPVTLVRLNYSVELRYGVLVDIATRVRSREPIDLSMGYFNVIWQGDVNDYVLRSLETASSPAKVINVTGGDILRVRDVAEAFGRLFGVRPEFTGKEAPTALLNNA